MREWLARLRGRAFRARMKLGRRRVTIAPNLRLHKRLDIRGPGTVIIGQDCLVGGVPGDPSQFVTIYTHAADAVVRIGHGARLYGARITCRFAVTIGNEVLIEEAGIADSDGHAVTRDRLLPGKETAAECAVTIGDRVCIGARSTIGKGVFLGDDAVVGPGAIVNRSLPAGCFALGNPARIIEPPGRVDGDT